MSAFGGVIALNRPVDKALAERLHEQFIEVLIAPGYEEGALDGAAAEGGDPDPARTPSGATHQIEPDIKRVRGGILVQDPDGTPEPRELMEVVTKTQPTEEQWEDLLFAWRVVRHVQVERDRARRATGPRSGSAPAR